MQTPGAWPWWASTDGCHSAGGGSASDTASPFWKKRALSFFADCHSLPLFQLAEEYGPVFTLHFGFQKVVVLTGYEVVREALVNYTEEFVDRPSIPIFDQIQNGNGTREMRGVGGRDGTVAQCFPRARLLKIPLGPSWSQADGKCLFFLTFMHVSFTLSLFLAVHLQTDP